MSLNILYIIGQEFFFQIFNHNDIFFNSSKRHPFFNKNIFIRINYMNDLENMKSNFNNINSTNNIIQT